MFLTSRRPTVSQQSRTARRIQARSRTLILEILEGRLLPSFLAPLAFNTGNRPQSVAVGEFNGDGLLDLAVANSGSNSVSVLLGTGDGSFGTARDFPAGGAPRSVVVGEFNGDGHPDLAVAHSGGVSVLLGMEDGSFQAARNFSAGSGPSSATVGDFNGDGHLDLAVANYGSSNVSVLLGTGAGTFQIARNFSAGGRANSVAAGDFNGDGRLDLAVTNPGFSSAPSKVSVLLSNGDGTFQAARSFSVGRVPHSVAVGDLNGDGQLDLVTANFYQWCDRFGYFCDPPESSAQVLIGNGDGSFQNPRTYFAGTGANSVAVGDVNSDGLLDLTVGDSGSWDSTGDGGVSVLLGIGDGSFQGEDVYDVGSPHVAVAVADFDGDGWLDVVTAKPQSNAVSILLNAADDAAFFYLDAPAQVTAGQPFDLTVYALNFYGYLAHGYTGTVAFFSASDPRAVLPPASAFRATDRGIASFPGGTALFTEGLQDIFVYDTLRFRFGAAFVDVVAGGGPGTGPNAERESAQHVATVDRHFAMAAEVERQRISSRPRQQPWSDGGDERERVKVAQPCVG